MREPSDAEIIPLENIHDAASLSAKFGGSINDITHMGPRKPGISSFQFLHHKANLAGPDCGGLFCRYAMSESSDCRVSCIMPIVTRLIFPYSERPKPAEFNFSREPLVCDLTPNILGPAEGFVKSGFFIHLGIGNEQEHTVTWKVSFTAQSVS